MLLSAVVLLAGCGGTKHTATSGHLHESADPFNQFLPHSGHAKAQYGSGPNGKPITTKEALAVMRGIEATCHAEPKRCIEGLKLITRRYKVQVK